MTLAGQELRSLGSASVARADLPVRILQIGAGNFLRAFADLMIHQANEAGVLQHGVAVMKATSHPGPVTSRLAEQDGLFHVVLDGVSGRRTTLVTAVREVVDAHAGWDRCRAVIRGADLRFVVSNTTEAGITFADGADLTASPPESFPAKMAALLHERWRHFAGDPRRGLVFLPCELIEDNGATLRAMVLRHAEQSGLEPGFLRWARDDCRFYDTIVDRIVPGLPEQEAAQLRQTLGYDDRLIVRGEEYGHWAIAGDPAIRDEFPLDRAGLPVEFLPDIRPYREKKVRILNGAHTAMAAVGPLLGCGTVLEATGHPLVSAYVRRLVKREVLPSLPGDPAGLAQFAEATLARFRNPVLQHRLADIALNATAKWHTRNLPVVLDAWTAGRGAPLSVLALASLLGGAAGALTGLPVRDDPAVLGRIRDSFTADDLQGWLAGLFPALGWTDMLDATSAARLAAETAVALRALLGGDPGGVLAGLLAPTPESDEGVNTVQETWHRLAEHALVPVVVLDDPAAALPLGQALVDGGLPVAEVTLRTPEALKGIQELAGHGGLLVGAGTVLTPDQVDLAVAAGARYIVSPGLSRSVVERCQAVGVPVLPGAVTATEVQGAVELGLDAVKFFPAATSGGPAAVAALAGPFAAMRFVPTGGIDAGNVADYLALPSVLAVGGSWMVPRAAIRAGDFTRVRELTSQAVAATRGR